MPGGEQVIGVTSRAGSSALWCSDGSGWAWGSDTTGQLGVGRGDGAVVEQPTRLVSKQLAELNVIQVRVRARYTQITHTDRASRSTHDDSGRGEVASMLCVYLFEYDVGV